MISNRRKLLIQTEFAQIGVPLLAMNSNQLFDSVGLTYDHESVFEIFYLKRGTRNYNIDGEEYTFQNGDAFIVFPKEKYFPGNVNHTKGCIYRMQIDSGCINLLGLDQDSTKLIINSINTLKSRKIQIRDEIAAKLTKAYSLVENGNEIDIIDAKSLLIVFICELIRTANSENKRFELSEPIITAKNYIDANIKEKISLISISENINFSLSHFKCKFKKEIGIPPGEYILQKKIYDSMSMLPDKSLTYIAYEYSFSSPQHYSKVFKTITGMTPKEYKSNITK